MKARFFDINNQSKQGDKMMNNAWDAIKSIVGAVFVLTAYVLLFWLCAECSGYHWE